MPNSAAMLRCSSLRFVLSTLSARWSSQLNSMVNNDLTRLSVVSIFALFILLGTNQLPGVLRACLSRWLHPPSGAHGREAHQAAPARQGCSLRPGALGGGPLVRQTRARLVAVGHERRCNTTG